MNTANSGRFPIVVLLGLGLCLAIAAPALAQTNVALTGTASTSGSNSSYPPSRLNDNVFSTWNWISTSGNPDPNAWMEISWTTPQTISGFTLHEVSATNRFLAQARIEWWNGSSWQVDSTYPIQNTAVYQITLAQQRTTTRFRLINFLTTGSQASNPSTYEWQIWGQTGPMAPAWINYPATSSGGNYTVSWAPVTGSGAITYDLEEDTSASFTSPTNVYNGPNTSFNVTNHPPGTFYYRARGIDSIGPGSWVVGGAIVVTVPPPSPPGAIIVPATSSTGTFQVQWTASTGATQYELQEANNSSFAGATQVYLGPNLFFNVSGKTGGTWWYQVRAVNAGGNSAFTQSTNGCQITAPSAPASITVPATSASGNFTVSWAPVGSFSYFLQEDSSASFSAPNTVYSGTSTSYNVTGKTSGTWWYRVCATNSVGNSPWTTSTNGCQIVPPQPPPSITVPATSVDGNFTVTWTASPTGATSYDLQEDTSSSFSNPQNVYTGSNLTFNVTGKTGGTWWYRVRANGVTGSSNWTASTNGCQIVPPAPPGSITVPATSATGNFTVTWTGSTGATSYDLEEDTSSGFNNPQVVYSGSNLSYNVTGKTSGTWWYRVRAANGSGASGWTASTNGCQIIPPPAPTPLNVPATSSTGTFQVSWGSSGSGVAYELQEDTSSAFTNAQTVYTGATLSYQVTGKMNGTYYYRVRASNGAGPSPWTTDTTGCTVTLAPPAAPVTVTVPATSSTGNYVVSWTGVAGAWTYDLEESTSPTFVGSTQIYTGSNTSYSITGNPNGTYYYRVRAGNGAGQSGWTNGSNGCTVSQMAPPAPGFLSVPGNSSTGNYAVSWGSVPSASLYELEEDTTSGFTGAVQVYRGAASNFQVTGRTSGTYYYRVRAVNVVGSSGWTVGGNPCVVSLTAPAVHVEPGPGHPGPTQEMPGALGVAMAHLKVSVGAAEAVNVLSIRVSATGTGDDSTEITGVRLIRDVDGDGAAGMGDVQAGMSTFSADDGNIDFDTSAQPPVPAGGTVHYLVECDFAGTAFTGSTFTFFVPVPVGVNCQGTVTLGGVTPTGSMVTGGVKTIATSGTGSLAVTLGGNSPVAGSVGFPASDVPLLQIRLSASSMEGVNVSSVKFATSGTGNDGAGVTARLVRDNNGDGQVSGGDVSLATGTISGDNGTLDFSGLGILIPANGSVRLLVVYDFASSVTPGTYGVSLEVGQDIQALGNSSSMGITATGAPVAGPLLTLAPGGPGGSGSGAVYFMGGCGAPVNPSPTGWAGLLLLLAAGWGLLSIRRVRGEEN